MSMIIIELCEITLQEPVLLLEDAAASCYLAKRHASFSGNLALWLAKEDKLGRALQDLRLKTREQALLLRREQIAASEEGRQVRRLSSFDFITGIDDFSRMEGFC